MTVRILVGDCRERLAELPDASVHCCVTSPPYFGLRDYGHEGQMGLESTPDEFVAGMVEVFREVRRVLRDDGTLWLNIGDSYWGSWGNAGNRPELDGGGGQRKKDAAYLPRGGWDKRRDRPASSFKHSTIKPKDLIGIPWMLAFALRADGWYLRQEIIWAKPNPMPESVRDRCTKAHEQIFLLSKSPRYYFDAEAIAEPSTYGPDSGQKEAAKGSFAGKWSAPSDGSRNDGAFRAIRETRNKRSVWEIAKQPFSEAHFATFPPALIEPCILAGCPDKCCAKCGWPWVRTIEATAPDGRKAVLTGGRGGKDADGKPLIGDNMIDHGARGSFNASRGVLRRETIGWEAACGCEAGTVAGTVLDPFGGAGTTGLVADRLGRNAVLIELNPEYAAIAERRLSADGGMFAEVKAA